MWDVVGGDVRDLVRMVGPLTQADARALLGAAGRFMARMVGQQVPSIDLLTDDAVTRFLELERLAGVPGGTLSQVSRRLRRLANARAGRAEPSRKRNCARVAALSPYSDADMTTLRVVAASEQAKGDGRLQLLLELVEQGGLRASALADHGLDSGVVAALRAVVREEAQLRLEMHRLRHRWLVRVLSQDAPVAVLMRRHSLGRDDLETVLPGLQSAATSASVIRSA